MSADEDGARRVLARVAARIAAQVEYSSAADGDTLRNAALEAYDAVRYASQRLGISRRTGPPTMADVEAAAAAVRAGAEAALMEAQGVDEDGARPSQRPTPARAEYQGMSAPDPDQTPAFGMPAARPPGRR